MKVFCPALVSGRYFPTKCAYRGVKGGQNISPGIEWTDVPAGVKSFVVSIVDRHPVAKNWVHWYVVNIPASIRELPENTSGLHRGLPGDSLQLRNSYGENGYGGPNPPRGSGPHEYEISVHALDVASLGLGPFATQKECVSAMHGHVLASGTVSGIFEQ
jgi:Raf kinase inhibitor-like YbhB/YbcL family protein